MKYGKTLLRKFAISGVAALGMGIALTGNSAPAAAQTYVCPPGYYFLGGYGCYPWGGYSYYAPPPVYYYPPTPYYPQLGLSFRFGDRDRDHGHDRGRGDHWHR